MKKYRKTVRNSLPSLACQAVTWFLVLLQLGVALPPAALAATPPESAPSHQRQVHLPPAAPVVKVNRTLPPGATREAVPVRFSAQPAAEEISRAAVLVEPLVPVGRPPTPAENQAFVRALEAYLNRPESEDLSALTRFLDQQPNSPWRVAVLVNLGILNYHAGRFSQTFPVWEEAWKLGQGATNLAAMALVDVAVGELARMNARVGRMDRLESLFAEIGGRRLVGSASEIVSGARRGLWLMQNEPWKSFRCGPMALDRIQAFENPGHAVKDCVYNSRSTTNGFSLQQVFDLSEQLGMRMRPAKRSPGAALSLPAVVNWKVGHYAALVREADGQILVQDPTFGGDLWVSRATLDLETSGYFLVKAGVLPAGWTAVSDAEAATVFGKGQTDSTTTTEPSDSSTTVPEPPGQCSPMAIANCRAAVVSLHIEDTPVRYTPPRGPLINFKLDYNQRSQYSSVSALVGDGWLLNWVSFIADNTNTLLADVNLTLPGGGMSRHTGFNPATKSFAPETQRRSVLTRTSPTSYVLRFPDGSQHLFTRPVGLSNVRIVLLTRILDAQDNPVDLLYDAANNLTAVVDSLGQVSTIDHAPVYPGDVVGHVIRITDPFGRFASFEYNGGFLTNITDVIGIHSRFTYAPNTTDGGYYIDSLTTPYGTSRFRTGASGVSRWLEMTDPEGATERVEFRQLAPGTAFTDPAGSPKGLVGFNQYMYYRNTFYWDKKAFREAPGDYTRARVFHWLHDLSISVCSGTLESEKQPLENRVWYNYPNQTWAGGINAGMIGLPSKIGRILDDGTSQIHQYEYNALGNLTKQIDPVGRTTTYRYATNLIDLIEVRQTAGVNDLLQSRTYNAQHLPLTVADGSGHTHRYTYNAAGKLLTATNPRNETTTLNYDANGYLLNINGPLPGTNDTTSFTYDSYGRVRTVTDSEGYTLTYDYDAIDHLTRTTYPDGTYEENIYQHLDRETSRDRNGRITRYTHDGNRRLTSVEDPLHRLTRYDWCACGQLEGLIDPMGRTTKWHRDIQGRVIAKQYVDGSKVQYGYEGTTSRLKTITDEKGQIKLYDYLRDDNVRQVAYLNPENPTPNVTFTYDGPYNRIASMQDGIGTTLYGYYPATTNGGTLAYVDGPLHNDTVTYDYDELGRVKTRAIDGVAQRWDYDPMGRITTVTNVLGAFNYNYVNATFRPAAMQYPNGQRTDYAYYDNLGDQRLQTIHNQAPGAQTLSKLDYAYDPAGQITNWVQQAGATVPENWALGYDASQQLLSAMITTNGVTKKRYTYGYDYVGNRLFEEIDDAKRSFSYNVLNQIQVSDDASLPARSYKWDAENRLVGFVEDATPHAIAYDGFGRYVRITAANGVVSEVRYVWCEDQVCEERNANGNVVVKRSFGEGQLSGSQPLYFAGDHLNSVREVTDAAGNLVSRYTYGPFGASVRVDGTNDIGKGFTGHPMPITKNLLCSRYRIMDESLARWLSRDPIDNYLGRSPYLYAENSPVVLVDPDGASPIKAIVLWLALAYNLIGNGIQNYDLQHLEPTQPSQQKIQEPGNSGRGPRNMPTKIPDPKLAEPGPTNLPTEPGPNQRPPPIVPTFPGGLSLFPPLLIIMNPCLIYPELPSCSCKQEVY